MLQFKSFIAVPERVETHLTWISYRINLKLELQMNSNCIILLVNKLSIEWSHLYVKRVKCNWWHQYKDDTFPSRERKRRLWQFLVCSVFATSHSSIAIVLSLSEGCNISLHLSGDRGNTSLLWADLSIVRGPGYTLLAEFAASYNITLILDWNITHIEYQLLLHNVSFICSCLFIHYDGSICHIDAINQIIPHPGHPHPADTVCDCWSCICCDNCRANSDRVILTIDPTNCSVMTQTFHRTYRPWQDQCHELWLVRLHNTGLLLAAAHPALTSDTLHIAAPWSSCPWPRDGGWPLIGQGWPRMASDWLELAWGPSLIGYYVLITSHGTR